MFTYSITTSICFYCHSRVIYSVIFCLYSSLTEINDEQARGESGVEKLPGPVHTNKQQVSK